IIDVFNDLAGWLTGDTIQIPDFVTPPEPGPDGYPKNNPSRYSLPRGDYDHEPRSQWVRATYPWVNYWRTPMRGSMDLLLTLSSASDWYRNWTNKYTLARSYEYRSRPDRKLYMYVMKDARPGEKGNEPWTRKAGHERADELFSMVAFAHRPVREVF